MEYGLFQGKKFSLMLKLVVYESYVRPAILYVSYVWCLKEITFGILRQAERCGV